ncbi:MAG: hypothetical protein AB2A00_24770 [Myxococcota bacterium]
MNGALLVVGLLAAATDGIQVVGHTATRQQDVLHWETRIVVDPRGVPRTLALHQPLPTNVTLVAQPDVTLVHNGLGDVVGISTLPRAWVSHPRGYVQLVLRSQERIPDGEGHLRLHPPLLATPAVQRVVIDGTAGLVFTPDPELGIERKIGSYASVALDRSERHHADALLGNRRARFTHQPLYLRVDDVLARHGLSGTLSSQAGRRGTAIAFAGSLFVGLLALLGAAYRRWRNDAEVARAEKIIRGEFEGL